MQLAETLREVELSRALAQELQSHVNELQEEVALREKSHNDTSLLSELENSLDALGWSQDKEQVIHCNITQNLSRSHPIMPDFTATLNKTHYSRTVNLLLRTAYF